MNFEVTLTREAEENLRAGYEWYVERSPDVAERWYQGMSQAITSLEENPERYAVANEHLRLGGELRQLNFRFGRRITHRIIFAVRPGRVVVHSIRHVAQQDWGR